MDADVVQGRLDCDGYRSIRVTAQTPAFLSLHIFRQG
jgi:hypothetical protein